MKVISLCDSWLLCEEVVKHWKCTRFTIKKDVRVSLEQKNLEIAKFS